MLGDGDGKFCQPSGEGIALYIRSIKQTLLRPNSFEHICHLFISTTLILLCFFPCRAYPTFLPFCACIVVSRFDGAALAILQCEARFGLLGGCEKNHHLTIRLQK